MIMSTLKNQLAAFHNEIPTRTAHTFFIVIGKWKTTHNIFHKK